MKSQDLGGAGPVGVIKIILQLGCRRTDDQFFRPQSRLQQLEASDILVVPLRCFPVEDKLKTDPAKSQEESEGNGKVTFLEEIKHPQGHEQCKENLSALRKPGRDVLTLGIEVTQEVFANENKTQEVITERDKARR